ncbi:MAG: hypothetical protein ONA90_03220, partial [candidate division KSB1 bacterium]|nr:hypothetical protein [candidate division KSB1 bacterium]
MIAHNREGWLTPRKLEGSDSRTMRSRHAATRRKWRCLFSWRGWAAGRLGVKLFYIVSMSFGVGIAAAQSLLISNPADMGDARANLVNPAVLPWQDPLFSLGTKLLHFG